jgi:hypothetical protein
MFPSQLIPTLNSSSYPFFVVVVVVPSTENSPCCSGFIKPFVTFVFQFPVGIAVI